MRKLLITAGPTHEPIDSVRFLGNRSSGRLGITLFEQARKRSWDVTLLLGPTALTPPGLSESDPQAKLIRFQTVADLQGLLAEYCPKTDVLVMAAAVADYTPAPLPAGTKLRRSSGPMTLTFNPTPDLLQECAHARRISPPQLLIGFALEPAARLLESAMEKLRRKRVDAIVANPLETMESSTIEATIIWAQGNRQATPGPITKVEFADWLLDTIERTYDA